MELLLNRKHELFHDQSGRPYYAVDSDGRVTTYDIESDNFKRYVTALYFERFAVPIKDGDRKRAIDTMAAQAVQKSPCYPMFYRTAWHEGKVYIDLANSAGQVVEITPDGWGLTTAPPVRFYRSEQMATLPVPVAGGSLGLLRQCINVNEADWPIIGGWLLDAAKGQGPYHCLIINGPQGSGKSIVTEFLRRMLDPMRDCQTVALPDNTRDLAVIARNQLILAIDNVSYLKQEQSDALCRLATGAGFAVRKLYTNDGLFTVSGARPLLLNGIPDFVEAPDLLDRSLIVELPVLPDDQRSKESLLRDQFAAYHAAILGALCQVLSAALAADDPEHNEGRMADSYAWMFRCSTAAGWGRERFVAAYKDKRELTSEIAVENCIIADVVDEFLVDRDGKAWYGTIKELLEALNSYLLNHDRWHVVVSPAYPKTPKKLGSDLRRHEFSLRRLGIRQQREPKGRQGRPIRLWVEPESSSPAIPATPPPAIEVDDWIDALGERIDAAFRG